MSVRSSEDQEGFMKLKKASSRPFGFKDLVTAGMIDTIARVIHTGQGQSVFHRNRSHFT